MEFLRYAYIKDELKETVLNLLLSLQKKSPETFEHSIEVANLSFGIGAHVGLSQDDMIDLYTAALLHDIGKLGIDKNILHCNHLTEEEIDNLRYSHIHKTYEILKSKGVEDKILNIAYHHHERLDGSGYPQHLKANDLSELDKILQVADTTSAIRMGRSYKEEATIEETETILGKLAEKGTLETKYISAVIDVLDEDYMQ